MAFFYTISYSTKVNTTPIYSYKNILRRISQDGLITPRHLVMFILFGISKTFFIGIRYTLLRTVTQLLVIFKPLLLVQKNQYKQRQKSYANYKNLKPTYIRWKATLIRNKALRTLIPYLKVIVVVATAVAMAVVAAAVVVVVVVIAAVVTVHQLTKSLYTKSRTL